MAAANNEEIISAFIDQQAIGSQLDFFRSGLTEIYDLYQKLNNTKVTLNGATSTTATANGAKTLKTDIDNLTESNKKFNTTIAEQAKLRADQATAATNVASTLKKEAEGYQTLIDLLTKNQLAQKGLTEEKKKLDAAFKSGQITAEQYTQSLSDINKSQLTLKTQNADITLSLKNLEKGFQSTEGSLTQLRAELNLSLQAFDRLSETEKKEATGQDLTAKIQSLTKTISEQEQVTGRFQRNVGNYANAFASALTPLQKALEQIKNDINSNNFSGEGLATLQKQEQALLQVTEQLTQEFSSSRQQSRAFQEAAAQIGVAFGQNSEVFQKFRLEVGEGVDSLNDIRDSIKLASSDTRQLDLLVGAAQGIAGGFAIAQGAASLFGNDSEELQKTLVKLNGVMTILNGLQAIQNELKNKDSVIRRAANFLFATEVKLTQADAVAKRVDAAATETATTATRGFSAALKASGIGILLTVIGLLITAFSAFGSKARDVTKDFDTTNEKAKILNDELKKMGETVSEIANSSIKELDEQIKQLNEELGENMPSAIDKANGALELLKKNQAEIINQLIAQKANEQDFFGKIAGFASRTLGISTDFEKQLTENQKQQAELRTKIQEAQQKQREVSQGKELENMTALYQQQTKIQANLTIDQNNRVLSNDKSTQAQRVAALKSNLDQQRAIIQQDLNKSLTEAGSDPGKRNLAQAQANADILKAQRDFNDQLNKLNSDQSKKSQEDALKNLQNTFNRTKAQLEQFAEFFRQQADDEKQSYDNRLSSLSLFYQQQQQLIEADRKFQESQPGADKATIEIQTQTKLLSLRKQFNAEAVALSQEEADKELAIAEAQKQKRIQNEKDIAQAKEDLKKDELEIVQNGANAVDTTYAIQYAKQEKALVDSFNAKEIDQHTYEQKSLKLQYDFQVKQLQNDINAAKRSLEVSNLTGDEKIELQKRIAQLELELAKATGEEADKIATDNLEKLKQKIQTIGSLGQNLGDIFSNLAGISIDKENASIQQNLDLLDEKKQKEIDVANQTIANEQDKAAKIIAINAKFDAQQRVLEDRKRQLQERQARFDKAANVANIITGTALAVVTTLKDQTIQPGFLRIPMAIAVGALGLAQLIRAIATPIPVYGEGTMDHTGGPAVVGDKYKKEVAVTPDGKVHLTPDKPTLMDLPKHTVVFPDADEFMRVSYSMTMPKVPTFEKSLIDNHAYMSEMTARLEKELRNVKSTIANKRENHLTLTPYGWLVMQKDGEDWKQYLNDNLHF